MDFVLLLGFFDWCHYNFWSSDICHYNSTIPKHAITIPSFTEPRHFLRIPRYRAHPQAYAYGRTPVVDAFAPPLASIGAGSPLPPLARSHSLPLPLLFPPGDGGGTLTLARRSTESIPAAASSLALTLSLFSPRPRRNPKPRP